MNVHICWNASYFEILTSTQEIVPCLLSAFKHFDNVLWTKFILLEVIYFGREWLSPNVKSLSGNRKCVENINTKFENRNINGIILLRSSLIGYLYLSGPVFL